ncbi:hypothetical protein OCU04_006072 [Sclerotinia nivalis]|uniref:SprT-like domain-containing protein n=1 Tax=Sclerotinia nivalis TaxID=352851 RepID=A0A9X0AQQ2_9HELO|nr:hypothetical protein OCU04_006072 [Sclerotinia nivalis]
MNSILIHIKPIFQPLQYVYQDITARTILAKTKLQNTLDMAINHSGDYCWILRPENRDPATGRWLALSHTYAEVVEVIVGDLRKPEMNARVNEVIKTWKTNLLSDLNSQTEKHGIEEIVTLYHEIFNDMFFSGALAHDRCEVRWRDNFRRIRGWTQDMRQHVCGGECQEGYESCDAGEQESSDFEEDGIYLDINDDTVNHDEMSKVDMPTLACMRGEIKAIIEIWRRPDIANRQERLRSYLETLLHEMIHAFLNIYTCLCSKCSHDIPRTIGHTGHGLPWHKIADNIERFVKSKLDLELDLERRACLAIEIQASGLDMRDQIAIYLMEDLNLGSIHISTIKQGDAQITQ